MVPGRTRDTLWIALPPAVLYLDVVFYKIKKKKKSFCSFWGCRFVRIWISIVISSESYTNLLTEPHALLQEQRINNLIFEEVQIMKFFDWAKMEAFHFLSNLGKINRKDWESNRIVISEHGWICLGLFSSSKFLKSVTYDIFELNLSVRWKLKRWHSENFTDIKQLNFFEGATCRNLCISNRL